MHSVAIGGVKQNVFAMAIAKSKHVANHADHSSCACVGYPCIVPGMQQKTDMTLSLFWWAEGRVRWDEKDFIFIEAFENSVRIYLPIKYTASNL